MLININVKKFFFFFFCFFHLLVRFQVCGKPRMSVAKPTLKTDSGPTSFFEPGSGMENFILSHGFLGDVFCFVL